MSYQLSRYRTGTWAETMSDLRECFEKWRVTDWSAEPNVPLARVNGSRFAPSETAVTVRYMKNGREVVLSMDSQEWPAGNLRALYLCIDAMRLLEVRGMADTVRSAYLQLEAPAKERDPWEVLGLRPGAGKDEIDAMYRVKAKAAHPDHGGSNEAMAALNAARDRLLAEAAS